MPHLRLLWSIPFLGLAPLMAQPISFASPAVYPTGELPAAVAVGDFNHDGNLDLAVANNSGASNSVSILLGKGDGTFRNLASYQTGDNPSAIAVADFNGDGNLDLAVGNGGLNTVAILLGNGDGTFRAPLHFNSGYEPFSVASADFNDDGIPDLAIANGNNNTVTIMLGNGDGTFKPRTAIPVAHSPFSLIIGDFNSDGNADIATANYTFKASPGTVAVLLGHGDGTFSKPAYYPAGNHPYYLAPYGSRYLAVVDYDVHKIRMMHIRSNGSVRLVESLTVGAKPFAVASADFNGDGIPDLAVSGYGTNSVQVLLGEGGVKFAPPISFTVGPEPEYFAVGDFNNDLKPDVAAPLYSANEVSILLNNTK
jgi:hypothetical protein